MMNILITGTSSGIGYGLALEFLKRGDNVWGISRRSSDLIDNYDNYQHKSIDLTDFSKVQKELPDFLRECSHLDLVVLNAGILGEIRLVDNVPVEEMKRVMEINVWTNKVILDEVINLVSKVKQVVGMSSKASLRSSPGWGSYSMSKAALNMLMDVYAKEHENIQFNAFAPGLVDSEIQDYIWNIKDTQKYPAAKRLQEARYTDTMPDAVKVAPKLIWGIEKAKEFPSGTFVDVRDI